ncbi:hypothetical protein [Blastococcus sp. CT_GayMR20]|uniref:hypothetical protein n=1 Tax=Blastococcus sp. CT_GayMR20 TaxID=2559609 RepID=UPI001ADDB7C6|nr:hypothetical protein [Blastococcus sp. CT_GayMR20]
MTTAYEFRMDGRLTEQAREAFCDMRIEEEPAGVTLYGDVIDESHLLGILAQCRMLGLVVVSAHRVLPRADHGRAGSLPHPRDTVTDLSTYRSRRR